MKKERVSLPLLRGKFLAVFFKEEVRKWYNKQL